MNIEFNMLTKKRLHESLGDQPGYFKLFYDVEGCGCNGVLVIMIVKEPYDTDIKVEAEPFSFIVDGRQESLFDVTMRLEADVSYPSFKLTSDASLFSSNIKLIDTRHNK